VIIKEALFDRVARFYDYENEDLVQDIPFYLEYAKECRGEVLEIACGTGRALIPLAQEGIKITGLDISDEMLKIAKEKVGRLDEKIKENIEFIHGDMANFDLKKKFSFIFWYVPFISAPHSKRRTGSMSCVCS
jgi:ubiquinone/menaquinone biosynthesis C-methylase UbiE